MADKSGIPGRGSGRGRGRGRAQGRGGRERSRGRPLNSSDRMLMFQLWQSLNTSARRQLSQFMLELGGNTQGEEVNTPPVERQEPPSAPEKSQKRVRIWEREILKNIPAVQEFGRKSAKDRGQDTETSKRLSIATGAISRGRLGGVSDEDILNDLISQWSDPVSLRSLYLPPEKTEPASAGDHDQEDDKTPVPDTSSKEPGPVAKEPSPMEGVTTIASPPASAGQGGLMDKESSENLALRNAVSLSVGGPMVHSNQVEKEETTSVNPGSSGDPVASTGTKETSMKDKEWFSESSEEEGEGEPKAAEAAPTDPSSDSKPAGNPAPRRDKSGKPKKKRKKHR